MRVRDLLGFATHALRGHRLRTGLSLLGVAIGVAAVVTLTALGEGARRYVVGQFASIGSNLVIVLPGKAETTGIVPVAGGAVQLLQPGSSLDQLAIDCQKGVLGEGTFVGHGHANQYLPLAVRIP